MKLSTLFLLMEGREDVLFAKYEQKIEQQLAHNGEKIEARSAFDQLFRAVGPKVADWAIRQYLKGQFRIEDATRVNTDILQYQKLSRQLPVEERDINKFDYRYIVNKLDELNKPEISTDAPDEDGVKVLYTGPYGFLCELLTKEAAIRLGKGTRWCTAADNDNRFDEYHTKGPLFFFQNTRGSKFQFQFEAKQFMDRRNKPIALNELNKMVDTVPVVRKLFSVKLPERLEHARAPIPPGWRDLRSDDPLAIVLQQALNKQHMHVLRIDKLKKEFPFLQFDHVTTYEHLHDSDRFIVKLLNMSSDQQYDMLKNIEHDADMRQRLIDGMVFDTAGKGTYIEWFHPTLGLRFYQTILKIQSPKLLQDLKNSKLVNRSKDDVRTAVHDLLHRVVVGQPINGTSITPGQFEYGIMLVQALHGNQQVSDIATRVAHQHNLIRELITDNCKTILLNECDPDIKPLLKLRLNGTQLNKDTLAHLLEEAENGKLPPPDVLAGFHELQIKDLTVLDYARTRISGLQAATEQQKEILYPTLILQTIIAIDELVLRKQLKLAPSATWLDETKAAPFYKRMRNLLSDVVNDGLYSFVDLVEHKEKTVDEIVDQLTSLYSQYGLAWYIKTDVWKRFVTDLKNGGYEE